MTRTALSHKVDLAVIGVDPSLTNTAACLILDGTVAEECMFPTDSSMPRPLRLLVIREGLQTFVRSAMARADQLVVGVEAEIWTASPSQSSDQSAVQGVLQVMLWETIQAHKAHHYLPVNVVHVKQYAGAQKKDAILLQVFKRWSREYMVHDQADAFIVAVIAHDLYHYHRGEHGSLWPDATKAQIGVLDRILKNSHDQPYPWGRQREGLRPKPRRRRRL